MPRLQLELALTPFPALINKYGGFFPRRATYGGMFEVNAALTEGLVAKLGVTLHATLTAVFAFFHGLFMGLKGELKVLASLDADFRKQATVS